MVKDIQLLTSPLSLETCQAQADDPTAGGTVLFIGTVRNHTSGKTVLRLHFEAYEPMAIQEMDKIAVQASEQWPLHRVAIHHRTGMLLPGDIAVIIAVSAAHRAEAFAACQYAIDTLKQTVPIWKKEFFEDGEVWVAAHP
ncbi:MAG: molybdenum cofactor biosynthesis protein MoaE [Saprospiraceae bacterium]